MPVLVISIHELVALKIALNRAVYEGLATDIDPVTGEAHAKSLDTLCAKVRTHDSPVRLNRRLK